MHMTKDYSTLTGQAKVEAAVADAKNWLSETQLRTIEEMAKSARTSWSFFHDSIEAFTGISGYPIQALWEHFGREMPQFTDKEQA